MEGAISPFFRDLHNNLQVLGIDNCTGNTHLQHEFSGYLGLAETVDPCLLNIYIMIHSLNTPSLVH